MSCSYSFLKSIKVCCSAAVIALALSTSPSNAASTPELTTHWIRANGVSLRYQLSGKGKDTIVLLHESGMSLETWDYIAPALAKTHQVLRYDLRGFGLSQAIKGPFSINDGVADLAELLKVLNINGKVSVVGVAIGGALALKFAADHPELVAKVIAISPAAYLQGRAMQSMQAPSPPSGGVPGGAPSGSPGNSPGAGPAVQDIQEGAYPTALRKADPARYERYKAIEGSAASASAGQQANMSAIYAVKYAEVLPTIRVPAVVAATSLWIRPVAEYKALADAIPNSHFEVLETGHFATLASPDLVIGLINKYIK